MQAAPDLPAIRRFEAAGFRAWPAASARYDGAWAVRLTPYHPARRLNSVNPLDPGDLSRIEERIERVTAAFRAARRPLTFRMSPLAGAPLDRHLDGLGWSRFDESIVMTADLSGYADTRDGLQSDIGRFARAVAEIRGKSAEEAGGLAAVLGSIKPALGMFMSETDSRPASSAVCVVDAGLAGLFEIATAPAEQRTGRARQIVAAALGWAGARGAVTGWLQVEAANEAARSLYRSMGFTDLYRYCYRQPPGTVR